MCSSGIPGEPAEAIGIGGGHLMAAPLRVLAEVAHGSHTCEHLSCGLARHVLAQGRGRAIYAFKAKVPTQVVVPLNLVLPL